MVNTPLTLGFPLYDAHGNNVAILFRSGTGYAVNDRRSYDAWGAVRAQQSGGDPKLRYCASLGHKQDDESGLVYMRARYYEPTSGRFVSEDPNQAGSNWFIYCENSPGNLVDRTGCSPEVGAGELFSKLLGGALWGAILGGAVGGVKEAFTENVKGYKFNPARIMLKTIQAAVGGALVGALIVGAAATVATGGVAAIAATAILLVNLVLFAALLDYACDELVDKIAPQSE